MTVRKRSGLCRKRCFRPDTPTIRRMVLRLWLASGRLHDRYRMPGPGRSQGGELGTSGRACRRWSLPRSRSGSYVVSAGVEQIAAVALRGKAIVMSVQISTVPATNRARNASASPDTRAQVTSALLREARDGGGGQRRELRARVVVLHLDVAESVARRYRGRGQDHDDLVQVARLGLVEAVERFDPDRGSFLAYGVPTMVGHVKRHFRDHSWFVRPPRAVQERHLEVSRARNDLTSQLRRQPSNEEIADHLGLDVGDVREAGNVQGCFHPTSLDAGPLGQDSGTGGGYADVLGGDDLQLASIDDVVTVSAACQQLSPDDRQILYLRFFLMRTQEDVAAELGTSQMQVSRRLRRILTQLRGAIGDIDPPAEAADRCARAG
jgi:RNA polymerase sigma-70 factor (sigma-B/F/G subfamily)